MRERNIVRVTMAEALLMEDRSDWAKVRAAEDKEEDEDEHPDWSTLSTTLPWVKKTVSIRLDPDVLEFFKAGGRGYQTRINAVLRAYMAAKSKAR